MLTKRQTEALETIKTFDRKFGYAPSMRELQAAMGLASTSVAHRLVKALEERGFIRRLRNRARAIEIVDNPSFTNPLSQYPLSDLAAEISRRGLVIGKIVTEHHQPQDGGDLVAVRKFKPVGD